MESNIITQAFLTLSVLIIMFLMPLQTVAAAIALPGCPDNCGDIPIPYPFGIGPGCYLKGFELNCINDTLAFLNNDVEVLNIILNAGQARVFNSIASRCYNQDTSRLTHNPVSLDLHGTPYRLNTKKNKFTVIGCNNLAYISFHDGTNLYLGGFVEDCYTQGVTIVNGSCTGVDGCWQTAIPGSETDNYHVDFDMAYNHSSDGLQCGFAVLMEEAFFLSSTENMTEYFLYIQQIPLILDWAIQNVTCHDAQANRSSYACRSKYSVCVDSTIGVGYLCNCSDGYEGNPYLEGGCQDIDECANSNPCARKCHNLPGSYDCSCPGIMHLKKNAAGQCEIHVPFLIGTILVLGFGTGLIILLIYFIIAKRIKLFEKRRQEKLKQKFFVQNRGFLLEQLIDSHEDTTQKMRIFRADELEKATNGFDNALILGQGGHGNVYKGILSDQRVVAIKRSKIIDQTEIDQFINEVAILSQVNHRNVVKLFGCCLETEVPLLVYEFISNGTLYHHLHVKKHCTLTWKHRLKIALDAAGAISYLHSSASISVFHRDLKSSNILLDDYFTAKVSDFGASRTVQIDQTGITTAIQGTHGYLDPEYYYTGRLTPKSDVYSFGVILAELLTREKPVFSSMISESSSLIAYFSSAMKENRLFEIVDPELVYEENRPELESVAKLAEMCLSMRGEERPTMKEVEVRIEVLWRSNKQNEHPWTSKSLEESELMLFDSATEIDISQQYSFEP